jgi:hypothetical protein
MDNSTRDTLTVVSVLLGAASLFLGILQELRHWGLLQHSADGHSGEKVKEPSLLRTNIEAPVLFTLAWAFFCFSLYLILKPNHPFLFWLLSLLLTSGIVCAWYFRLTNRIWKSDPLVYVEVEDRKEEPRFLRGRQTAFMLVNRGGRVARNVQLVLPLSVGSAVFDRLDALPPNEPREVIPTVQGANATADRFHKHNLFLLLREQPTQSDFYDSEKVVTFTVTYSSYSGTRHFEMSAVLRYLSMKDSVREKMGNPSKGPIVKVEQTEIRRLK